MPNDSACFVAANPFSGSCTREKTGDGGGTVALFEKALSFSGRNELMTPAEAFSGWLLKPQSQIVR